MTRARLASLLLLATAAACGTREPPPAPAAAPLSGEHLLVISGQRDQLGFDRRVTLRAEVRADGAWELSWKQLWGPAPRGLRVQGGVLELVTPPAPPAPPPGRGPIVALGAAAAGRLAFRVEAVSAGGQRLERFVEIFPAYPSGGWPRVALGVDLFLRELGGERWSVRAGPGQVAPSGLAGLSRLRASGVEWLTLRSGGAAPHTSGGGAELPRPPAVELKVRAGVWLGDTDCGRFDCHPREARGWARTAHATIFTRGLSGELPRSSGRYGEECIACHTVGYQPSARNDGFDDRAHRERWSFPARPSPRAWRDLPRELRDRANVQCESCHGPGWFYVAYGDEVCAQCHDHPPRYQKVAQARLNRMSVAERAVAGQPAGTVCAGCHVGREVLRSLRGHASTSRVDLELEREPRGVTCPVCHDPHATDCRRQLRLCGDVEIPGATFDAGQGALCVACHSGEVNVVQGPLLRPFLPGRPRRGSGHAQSGPLVEREPDAAPHAPQFQLLTGRGGRFLRLPTERAQRPTYPHMGVPDSCVGCHLDESTRRAPAGGHTFKLLAAPTAGPLAPLCTARASLAPLRASPATASCARCHGRLRSLDAPARGDYDGDGRVSGLVEEVEHLLGLLRRELGQQLEAQGLRGASGAAAAAVAVAEERLVLADAQCRPLRDAKGGWLTLAPEPKGRRPVRPAPTGASPRTADRAALQKAAFNLLFVLRDGSGGLHNPQYVVTLLQSTLEELEAARGASVRHAWKRP